MVDAAWVLRAARAWACCAALSRLPLPGPLFRRLLPYAHEWAFRENDRANGFDSWRTRGERWDG